MLSVVESPHVEDFSDGRKEAVGCVWGRGGKGGGGAGVGRGGGEVGTSRQRILLTRPLTGTYTLVIKKRRAWPERNRALLWGPCSHTQPALHTALRESVLLCWYGHHTVATGSAGCFGRVGRPGPWHALTGLPQRTCITCRVRIPRKEAAVVEWLLTIKAITGMGVERWRVQYAVRTV